MDNGNGKNTSTVSRDIRENTSLVKFPTEGSDSNGRDVVLVRPEYATRIDEVSESLVYVGYAEMGSIDNVFPEWEQIGEVDEITNQRVSPSTATLRQRFEKLHLSDKDYRYTSPNQYKEIEQIWLDQNGDEYYKLRVPVLKYSEQKALTQELEAMKAALENASGREFPEWEGDPMPLRDWQEMFTQKE